ncbi:transmembrane protein 106B-like isoform X2 [Antedon mediterranea]
MICPTCKGTGRIPPGQEDQLVALIPYRDGRLKPRRTWLWVALSILGCAIVAGILCFILIPRDIKMTEPTVNTERADLNKTKKSLLIELNFMFNVTNDNFLPVTVNEVDVEALFNAQVVGNKKYTNASNVHSRSTQLIYFLLNVAIDASTTDNSYLLTICDPNSAVPYPHLLYLTFVVTMHTKVLAQDKENSLNTYPIHVSCETPSHNPYAADIIEI